MPEEFFHFEDEYAFHKRLKQAAFLQYTNLHPDDYYDAVYKACFRPGVTVINGTPTGKFFQDIKQTAAQHYWRRRGMPYVKVYPSMVRMLSNIKIDIDAKHLHIPHGALEIRLPVSADFRESPDAPALQSMLIASDMWLKPNEKGVWNVPYIREHPDTIILNFSFGQKFYSRAGDVEVQETPIQYFLMERREGVTLEDSMRECMSKPINNEGVKCYFPSEAMLRKMLSIAVAACFFVNDQHEQILPDLPRRLAPAYERAQKMKGDEKKAEERKILAKARDLGHFGWALGRRYEMEVPRPVYERDPKSEKTGETHSRGELAFSHVRSPHPRWQPVGPRENPEYKLIFIPPAVVRPDLPPSPVGRAYKITDRPLEQAST